MDGRNQVWVYSQMIPNYNNMSTDMGNYSNSSTPPSTFFTINPSHTTSPNTSTPSNNFNSTTLENEYILSNIRFLLKEYFPDHTLTVNNRVVSSRRHNSQGTLYEDSCPGTPIVTKPIKQEWNSPTKEQFDPMLNASIPAVPSVASTQRTNHSHLEVKDYTPLQRHEKTNEKYYMLCVNELSTVFCQYGIDILNANNTDVFNAINEILVQMPMVSGTLGKRTVTLIMNKLYPHRRKLFPYSLQIYPADTWPSGIPYKDPSHLTRNQRLALLIWALVNPLHSINVIVDAYKTICNRNLLVPNENFESYIMNLRNAVFDRMNLDDHDNFNEQ